MTEQGHTVCNFCQADDIVIIYRDSDGKVIAACKKHKPIVDEMLERDDL